MAAEVLHVLQHEVRGLVVVEDLRDGEEEVALLLVLEAVLAAEAVLLGHAREAEGLARKAAAEDVVRRDVGYGHGMDVAMGFLAEVRLVGLPGILVPVAGEDALRARLLEGDAEPADAAEQVNETQGAGRRALLGRGALLPSDARRSGAVGRRVFVDPGRAVLPRRPIVKSVACGGGPGSTAAGDGTVSHDALQNVVT